MIFIYHFISFSMLFSHKMSNERKKTQVKNRYIQQIKCMKNRSKIIFKDDMKK